MLMLVSQNIINTSNTENGFLMALINSSTIQAICSSTLAIFHCEIIPTKLSTIESSIAFEKSYTNTTLSPLECEIEEKRK